MEYVSKRFGAKAQALIDTIDIWNEWEEKQKDARARLVKMAKKFEKEDEK
jgi:hypothetical protein